MPAMIPMTPRLVSSQARTMIAPSAVVFDDAEDPWSERHCGLICLD
jgi:hypothetical protein